MAHEISVRSDGRAEAFFGMNEPAWHGLGKVVAGTLNSAQAIEAAGLDWTVTSDPIFDQDGKEIEGYRVNRRSDSKAALGIVSDDYQIVDNREAFDFVDGLLADGVMKYETAGALKGGRVIWMLATMPGEFEVVAGDAMRRYVLLSTAHDGSRAVQVSPTSIRVVCANTLRMADRAAGKNILAIRHTESVKQRLQIAQQVLTQANKSFDANLESARRLVGRQISDAMFYQYIGKLWPEPEASAGERTKNNYSRAIRALENNYFHDAKQQIAGIARTPWAAYNAVTQLIDHPKKSIEQANREARESLADKARRKENHFASVMMGAGASFKQEAFDAACELVQA